MSIRTTRCASPAFSRTPRPDLDDLLLALRVAVSLAAVLGLLWFVQRRFAKGLGRGAAGRSRPITVVARQGLGAKAQLVIVQTDDARYVLGVTEHGVSVVDRFATDAVAADAVAVAPAPAEGSAAERSSASDFEGVLSQALDEPDAVGHSIPRSDAPAPLRQRTRHRSDPLQGSILSAQTWRQTAEAIRRSR